MASTARNRFGNVGSGSNMANGEQARPLHGSAFRTGFGSGQSGWNINGGIWGNTAIGSGLKNGSVDSGRVQDDLSSSPCNTETITGSGSLLPSSESDSWGSHHPQWKTVDSTSPTASSSHTNHSNSSPMRRQSSNQFLPQSIAESSSGNPSYFAINPGATISQGLSTKPSRKPFPDPPSGSFIVPGPFDQSQLSRSSRQNSDEDNRYTAKAVNLSCNEIGYKMQPTRHAPQSTLSGYTSSAASGSGSLPPSHNGAEPSRYSDDPVNTQFQHLGQSASTPSHRPNLSAHAPSHAPRTESYGQRFDSQTNPIQLGAFVADFSKMNVGREIGGFYSIPTKEASNGHNNNFTHEYSHQLAVHETGDAWSEDNAYQANLNGFSQDGGLTTALLPYPSQYRAIPFGAPYSPSPSNSDARRSQQSPFYSTGAASPASMQSRVPKVGIHVNDVPSGQAALLDRKLRGLQQEQQGYPSQPNPMQFRPSFTPTYDFRPTNSLRMNPHAHFYHMPAASSPMIPSHVPRGPARENEVGHVRSALLEEFRTSGKTNKRYELKDIYNYVVEFSGDQHGSRFIQQKLETANSDEKEQVFREIHPNALQLTTDVFGNYVIQKFFEHGNQGQKKILASQMKNHILTLSLQMYGCRVVQKALEHILTDQQALLVKELEHHVLKCVKDQNGNHVIQKAIERVPAEHIQFIINAFTGQVHGLATHAYGCRVIQRMLEHCKEPTRSTVLQELHACASALITDQYGNYVTQHVIEHGRDEDRAKVISLVAGNLVSFSKHKFASNVVEKSIEFGTADQRAKIISTLAVLNDKGESPLLSLIRDQYGNYVIQKLLTQLKDSESDRFIELIKPQLALLKRFSYGKQIAAIEKIVYNSPVLLPQAHNNPSPPPPIDTSAAPTPPPLISDAQSPQSISLPSTNASCTDGLVGSRKSSASNTLEVMTLAST